MASVQPVGQEVAQPTILEEHTMQRFNDRYFRGPNHHQPYGRRRPRNNGEIRIPVRRNGYPVRKTINDSSKHVAGDELQQTAPVAAVPNTSPTQAQPEQIKTLTAEAAEWKEKYTDIRDRDKPQEESEEK